MGVTEEIQNLAIACATRLREDAGGDRNVLEPDFSQLLERVRTLDPAFGFDREGRPGAIAAVREALPLQEQELFDAIIEDFGCEIAAVREAMSRIARAPAGAGFSSPTGASS